MMIERTKISYQTKQVRKNVLGISAEFNTIRKFNLEPSSRNLNPLDIKDNARVTILGSRLKALLFGKQNAIGKQIIINKVSFTVVGAVKKPQDEEEHDFYGGRAIIPYTTFIQLWGNRNVTHFLVLPNMNANLKLVEDNLRSYLASKYHFDPSDQNALTIFNTAKIFQFFKWFFIGMQAFLGVCGSLTLAVGGLGVTNIMFLIVSERTREIGLRLAIGARDRDIIFQIMLETSTIVVIGGIIGLLLSYLFVIILSHVTLPTWLGKPTISPLIMVTTIIILALLGILAGYFPARRAAKLDPVEALGFK